MHAARFRRPLSRRTEPSLLIRMLMHAAPHCTCVAHAVCCRCMPLATFGFRAVARFGFRKPSHRCVLLHAARFGFQVVASHLRCSCRMLVHATGFGFQASLTLASEASSAFTSFIRSRSSRLSYPIRPSPHNSGVGSRSRITSTTQLPCVVSYQGLLLKRAGLGAPREHALANVRVPRRVAVVWVRPVGVRRFGYSIALL